MRWGFLLVLGSVACSSSPAASDATSAPDAAAGGQLAAGGSATGGAPASLAGGRTGAGGSSSGADGGLGGAVAADGGPQGAGGDTCLATTPSGACTAGARTCCPGTVLQLCFAAGSPGTYCAPQPVGAGGATAEGGPGSGGAPVVACPALTGTPQPPGSCPAPHSYWWDCEGTLPPIAGPAACINVPISPMPNPPPDYSYWCCDAQCARRPSDDAGCPANLPLAWTCLGSSPTAPGATRPNCQWKDVGLVQCCPASAP